MFQPPKYFPSLEFHIKFVECIFFLLSFFSLLFKEIKEDCSIISLNCIHTTHKYYVLFQRNTCSCIYNTSNYIRTLPPNTFQNILPNPTIYLCETHFLFRFCSGVDTLNVVQSQKVSFYLFKLHFRGKDAMHITIKYTISMSIVKK